MSRRRALTPEVEKTILDAIEGGNWKTTACALAGIHRDTLYGWEERAAAGEEPFASFYDRLREAEAKAETKLVADIRHAKPLVVGESGADIWQARAWLLERRYPKRWGMRVRAAVNEELEALLARLEKKLDAETFTKVVDAAREDAGGEASGDDTRH